MTRRLSNLLGPWGWALGGGAVLLVIVLVWWVLTEPGRQRERAGRAEAGETFAEARTDAARDAGEIRDKTDAANAATREQVQEAQDDVRQADPADRDRIARERLCRLNPGACAR